jgi:hypothetical protein
MTIAPCVRRLGSLVLLAVCCVWLAGCGNKGGQGKAEKAQTGSPGNFEKVQNGMTEKEVTALLGTPTQNVSGKSGKVLLWTSKDAVYTVSLGAGDKVVYKAVGRTGK